MLHLITGSIRLCHASVCVQLYAGVHSKSRITHQQAASSFVRTRGGLCARFCALGFQGDTVGTGACVYPIIVCITV